MSEQKCYYFDTNALIKHYISQDQETTLRRLSTTATVYISNLTYLEMLGVLMKFFRKKEIKRKHLNSIIEQLKRDIGTTSRHRFQLITTQEGVFQKARALMIRYAEKYELGTNDSLHIAMASLCNPPVIMVTSDGGKNEGKMKGICKEINLHICDPEIDTNY